MHLFAVFLTISTKSQEAFYPNYLPPSWQNVQFAPGFTSQSFQQDPFTIQGASTGANALGSDHINQLIAQFERENPHKAVDFTGVTRLGEDLFINQGVQIGQTISPIPYDPNVIRARTGFSISNIASGSKSVTGGGSEHLSTFGREGTKLGPKLPQQIKDNSNARRLDRLRQLWRNDIVNDARAIVRTGIASGGKTPTTAKGSNSRTSVSRTDQTVSTSGRDKRNQNLFGTQNNLQNPNTRNLKALYEQRISELQAEINRLSNPQQLSVISQSGNIPPLNVLDLPPSGFNRRLDGLDPQLTEFTPPLTTLDPPLGVFNPTLNGLTDSSFQIDPSLIPTSLSQQFSGHLVESLPFSQPLEQLNVSPAGFFDQTSFPPQSIGTIDLRLQNVPLRSTWGESLNSYPSPILSNLQNSIAEPYAFSTF